MISDGWKKVPISEFLIIKHGKSQKGVVIISGGFPILGSGGEIGRARKPLYEKESVLIGRKGTINKPVFINEPFWTIDTLFYSEIKPKRAFPKWVFYEFCYRNWMEYNEASGVPSLNAKTISSIQTLLPPLSEQKKIADILTSVDESIQATQKVIDQSEKVKQGLLQELFTKGIGHTEFKQTELGKIPLNWGIGYLSQVAEEGKGTFVDGPFGSNLKSSEYINEGIRIIQLQNIGDGHFNNWNFKYISVEKAEELKRHIAIGGDIIIAKMAEPIFRAAIVPDYEDKWVFVADCMRLRVNKALYDNNFICYAINSKFIRHQAEQKGTGTTRKRINLTTSKSIKILLPPHPEQKKIATILSSVDKSIQKSKDKKSQLELVKKGLMQDLLTGKVRVKV